MSLYSEIVKLCTIDFYHGKSTNAPMKYYPVDNFGTVVGENPDCLLHGCPKGQYTTLVLL